MSQENINQDQNDSYTLTFVVQAESSDSIRRSLSKHAAHIVAERPLQKIKLAYLIRKQAYGFLGVIEFKAMPEHVSDLMKSLQFDGDVLRYLLHRMTVGEENISERSSIMSRSVTRSRPVKKYPEPALSNEALERKIEELR
ncbi:30S ribosomal protein S6 [Candidatus Jorgensenbacteria bacterium]|nr:30S ribosomal protein S6 [Candidatus Jorgensenbacteria bacterium]